MPTKTERFVIAIPVDIELPQGVDPDVYLGALRNALREREEGRYLFSVEQLHAGASNVTDNVAACLDIDLGLDRRVRAADVTAYRPGTV